MFEVISCYYRDGVKLKELLRDGWEPFGVDNAMVYLRKINLDEILKREAENIMEASPEVKKPARRKTAKRKTKEEL